MEFEVIERTLAKGVPLTCASCKLYYEGDGHCGRMQTCGGPLAGRDFPDYDGPIPKEKFVEVCLICGNPKAPYLIVGLTTKFALCAAHQSIYDKIPASEGVIARPVNTLAKPDMEAEPEPVVRLEIKLG